MKSDLECLVCLLKQALNTVRISTKDAALQRAVLDRVAREIPRAELTRSPAEISTRVYEIVSEVTGNPDPYRAVKTRTNAQAMAMLPELRARMARAVDPLSFALHLAVAGNVIDLGIGHAFDLERDLEAILETPFARDGTERFAAALGPGRRLLYLGDNAGEIVFDRLLVEWLKERGVSVTFAVKSAPVINDATLEDAEAAGITELVPVVETGSGDIGVNFARAGEPFIRAFHGAELRLAKGHGNFETLHGTGHGAYFLLKAKCPIVARELGVPEGAVVFACQEGGGAMRPPRDEGRGAR